LCGKIAANSIKMFTIGLHYILGCGGER